MKRLDLAGKVFGRWTVLGPAKRTYQTMWRCECACGVERDVSGINLTTGHSISCGCFREENRPNLCKNRDFTGTKNPKAQKSISKNGEWVPSTSVWYKRASGIYYSARKKKVPLGFKSVPELALYIKGIAGDICPVFGVPFELSKKGFHDWSPSIDKIDPIKGYVKGNIQVISVKANCMKRDASPEQLVQFANWILK